MNSSTQKEDSMKALVLTEYKHFEMQQVPKPEIADDEVLIQVQACGICGSDIHGMDGSSGRRIPPIIMGHEATGTITAVGAKVQGWSAGEGVTFDSMIFCGKCAYCRSGNTNLCDNRRVLGVSCGDYRRHGAFADYVVVPEKLLVRLPKGMSFEHAAMGEPVAIAVHAVNITPLPLNSTVVVVGAGMIGLLIIQTLRLRGCKQIIAVDIDAGKLEMAASMGADITLQASKELDAAAKIMELTDGRGADVAIEAVGNTPAVQTALRALRKGGNATIVGNLAPTIEFPLQLVVTREITVRGSCASCNEFEDALDLIATKQVDVTPLISKVAPLEEGQDWFTRLYAGEAGLMKVILKP